MSAHTPGPWAWDSRNGTVYLVAPDAGVTVACVDITGNDDRGKADARLIAAAPDLLAALVGVLTRLEGLGISSAWPDFDVARAAIAKAAGRP